jgi:hypothetical protein
MGSYTAKTSKVTLVVDGLEKEVDELFEAQELVEVGTALIEEMRPTVQDYASDRRVEASANGDFTKTVSLQGSRGAVAFTFGNKFCKIPLADEKAMRADLGDRTFDLLFTRKVSASVKPEALNDLLALLGNDAEDYLDVEETVAPVSEFREKRFELRSELSSELNGKIDEVVEKVQAKPSMKFKPNT